MPHSTRETPLHFLLPKKLMISSMALEVFFVLVSSFDSARIELILEQSTPPADTVVLPHCHCVCRCELHLRNFADSANALAYYASAAFSTRLPLVILRTEIIQPRILPYSDRVSAGHNHAFVHRARIHARARFRN